jgi:large subunit ribosomal protein L6
MSRIAKYPVQIPTGVEVLLSQDSLVIKGRNGELSMALHPGVRVGQESGALTFAPKGGAISAQAMAGTTRALANNMVVGVSTGFQRRLTLVGVGYRAAVQGNKLNLTLGFSHPVVYELPDGVTAEVPSQTEILLKAADKQLLGQVAAEIRAFRPPEPYKGKGVRYADEQVRRKEAKKK